MGNSQDNERGDRMRDPIASFDEVLDATAPSRETTRISVRDVLGTPGDVVIVEPRDGRNVGEPSNGVFSVRRPCSAR